MPGPRSVRAAALGSLLAAGLLASCTVGGDRDEAGASVTAMATASPVPGSQTPGADGSLAPSTGADQMQVATDPDLPTGPGPVAPEGDGSQLSVTVVTTYASQDGSTVEVSGYVIGAVEEDGTCTLTLTSGSTTREVRKAGVADATTTSCAGLQLDRSDLSEGTWRAVLSYSSPRSLGAADAVTLDGE